MAKRISQTQAQLKNLDWLLGQGESADIYDDTQTGELEDIIIQYAEKFKDNLLLNIKKKECNCIRKFRKEYYHFSTL